MLYALIQGGSRSDMNNINRFIISLSTTVVSAILISGCATTPKASTTGEIAPAPAVTGTNAFLKGMDVVEKPELEPEWGTFVKDHYPNWRTHYWVDRGQWGNRGYIVGRPTATAEPVVETEVTPLPPVPPQPPVIEETTPPKVVTPEKPTKYIVKKGDSLWKISGKVYGNPLKWSRIYKANKDKIKNPNRVYIGQVLTIPQD